MTALWFVGWLLAPTAHGQALEFLDVSCAPQATNVLRADCHVTTDVDTRVRIVFREAGTKREHRSPSSGGVADHDLVIWGLKADRVYEYWAEARVHGSTWYSSAVSTFATQELIGPGSPAPFDNLEIRHTVRPGATPEARLVAIDVECGSDLAAIVFDARDGEIVWYDTIPNELVTAVHVTGGGHLVLQTDMRNIYEWSWDGSRIDYDLAPGGECENGDGPCLHHEMLFRRGEIFTLMAYRDDSTYGPAGLDGCMGKSSYALDEVWVFDRTWSKVLDTWSLDTDLGYFPDGDLGPNFNPGLPFPSCSSGYWSGVLGGVSPIDPLHVNAIALDGGSMYVSIPHFDQVIRFDMTAGAMEWRLHGSDAAYSDFPPMTVSPSILENARTSFKGQHHLSSRSDGMLQMFDNNGGSWSRVLAVDVDAAAGTAQIERVWTLADDDGGKYVSPSAQRCNNRSGGYELTPDVVLATCSAEGSVSELDADDGTTAAPVWFWEASCSNTGRAAGGIYRGVPVRSL